MTNKQREEFDSDTIEFKISTIKAYMEALEAKRKSG